MPRAFPAALLPFLFVAATADSFGISDQGAITSVLQSVDTTGHIRRSTASVVQYLTRTDAIAVCGVNPASRINNYYDEREKLRRTWHEKVGGTARGKGLNIHPHGNCTRQVSHNESEIRDIMREASFVVGRLNRSARVVAERVGFGNWSTPTAFLWHSFTEDAIVCKLAGFSGLRRNAGGRAQWYLKVGVTNEAETLYLPMLQRQYVIEHIRASVGRAGAVFEPPANVSAFRNRLPRGPKETNITTTLGLYGGKPTPSQFYALSEDKIASFRDAFLRMEKEVDVSAESMLASNILILAMPIILNFLPVAFISGVGTLGVLLYVLVTDILTALPLAIKGWELLQVASNEHIAANSWILGHPSLGDALSEHWIAKCQTNDRFRVNGIIFLSCALLAIVLGISLELIAAKLVKHEKADGGSLFGGKSDLYMLKSGCDQCNCHAPYIPLTASQKTSESGYSTSSWSSSLSGVRQWFSPWFTPRTPKEFEEPVYEYSKAR